MYDQGGADAGADPHPYHAPLGHADHPAAAEGSGRGGRPVPDQPLNSIQKAIIAASVAKHRGVHPTDPTVRDEVRDRVKTVGDAFRYLSQLL